MAEAVFLMRAANGLQVRVPESKLESWQKAQDEIRAGKYRPSERQVAEMMSRAITKAQGGRR